MESAGLAETTPTAHFHLELHSSCSVSQHWPPEVVADICREGCPGGWAESLQKAVSHLHSVAELERKAGVGGEASQEDEYDQKLRQVRATTITSRSSDKSLSPTACCSLLPSKLPSRTARPDPRVCGSALAWWALPLRSSICGAGRAAVGAQAFDAWDVDNSGKLSPEEVDSIIQSIGASDGGGGSALTCLLLSRSRFCVSVSQGMPQGTNVDSLDSVSVGCAVVAVAAQGLCVGLGGVRPCCLGFVWHTVAGRGDIEGDDGPCGLRQ